MVRRPLHSATPDPTDHLTELETCIKILKHLPPSERPAILDRINHKISCLSQDSPKSHPSGPQGQRSQIRSDNNQQQQLSTIEHLVSAKAALGTSDGPVPDMQPLIKKWIDVLGKVWPVPGQDTEGKGELEAFFAGLRRNENKLHSPSHIATLASTSGEGYQHQGGFEAALANIKTEQRPKDERRSQELEATLVGMRKAQKKEDEEESEKLDEFFAGLRGAPEDKDDQEPTREVEALVAGIRITQRKEDKRRSRELEAKTARIHAAGHFSELGLFESPALSTPRERNHCPSKSPKRNLFPLTSVKTGPRATDTYISTSELQYHLLFDPEANSYTLQKAASTPPVQRSDMLSFHVNAIKSVDYETRGGETLQVDLRLESGKEVGLVFENAEDRLGFWMNVYQTCPELE